MNAEQVVNKILSDAQSQADQIKQQAQKVYDANKAVLQQELSEYAQQSQSLAEKAAADKKSRILAAARMEVAKEYLAVKGQMIDEVFGKASQKFNSLSDDDYRQLMTELLKKSVETGDEEVIVDNNETRLTQDFIKNVNRELGPGFKGNLRLSDEKEDIKAGFILKRGQIRTNASIGVLLDQARGDLQIELAKEFFED